MSNSPMLTLADVANAPHDPDELVEHLRRIGAIPSPPAQPAAPLIPEMTPPKALTGPATTVPYTSTEPEHPIPRLTHVEEPSMASEMPSMSPPAVPSGGAGTGGGLVKPMTAPTLTEGEKAELPVTSPGTPAGSVPYYEAKLGKAIAADTHDKMEDHPSFLGKVGHVLGRVGNVLGDVFVPGAMQDIPGTDLYKKTQVREAEQNLAGAQKEEGENRLRAAEGREAEARADALEHPEKALGKTPEEVTIHDLMTGGENGGPRTNPDTKAPYTYLEAYSAVQEAKAGAKPDAQPKTLEQALVARMRKVMDQGGDTSKDPETQAWADAIKDYKPMKNESAAEGIKKQIVDAIGKGDIGEVQRLQGQLRAIDPEGTERLLDTKIRMNESFQQHADKRSEDSYKYNNNLVEKRAKPVEDAVARMSRLEEVIKAGTPIADALVAPELLTIMAGGAGSGLRMTDTEINRIVGGQGHWDALRRQAQLWALDPSKANSITPEQRKEIRALMVAVHGKLAKKSAAIDDARSELLGSGDPASHKRTVFDLEKKLNGIDNEGATGGGGGQKVKIGGKEYDVDSKGQINVNGVTYQTTPGSKEVKRVKQP